MAKKNATTPTHASQGTLEVPVINAHAAGIDVGSRFHVVAVGQTKADVAQFGVTTPDLHELAKAENEEITLQNKMLETLETKIDHVNDHVVNVNAKLKTTLEEARKSDKICMVSFVLFCFS